MKKIALISSFCDAQNKIDLLHKNILMLKNLGIDVMVFTPFALPNEINEAADYILISKENPLLDWPEKSYFQWWDVTVNGQNMKMSVTYPDYGFAGLTQVKRMADLALSMEYDLFFPMIYDININDHVKNVLLDTRKNSFFPSMRGGQIWSLGLHLISLDRDHLIRLKNLITKESYLIESEFDAFAWLHRAVKLIPGKIETEPIEDLIYFFDNKDFFDFSIIENIKCFIHKIEGQDIKLVFYNFGGVKNFKVKTENFTQEYSVMEWEELTFPFANYESFIVTYEGRDYDFTNILLNIKHNIFIKNT
jgi:hypothetical protein